MAVKTIEPPPLADLDQLVRRTVDRLDALTDLALRQVEPPKTPAPAPR